MYYFDQYTIMEIIYPYCEYINNSFIFIDG